MKAASVSALALATLLVAGCASTGGSTASSEPYEEKETVTGSRIPTKDTSARRTTDKDDLQRNRTIYVPSGGGGGPVN